MRNYMNQKLSGFVYGVDASSMFSQAMSSRLANVLNVSVDGSPGYLKPLRQLRSGDLVLLQ